MTNARATRRSGKRRQSYLPVSYYMVGLVLLFIAFPTVLRPPQEPPGESAELSPDAPPDEQVESIVETVSQAQTGTAGAGSGEGAAPAGEPPPPDSTTTTAPASPPSAPARACPFGFGDPPRQTESVYAPPCAEAFTGDNGGDTHRGVTATEIRIGVSGVNNAMPNREGPVNPPQLGDNATMRTLQVLETYFNQAFQLWGRQLRFFAVRIDATNPTAQRQTAQRLDQEFQVFAAGALQEAMCDEFARRDLVAMCPQLAAPYFEARQPHLWSWNMDGTKLARFQAEYACKKLVGRNAVFSGGFQGAPRKFGLVVLDVPNTAEPAAAFKDAFREQCGGSVVEVRYGLLNDLRIANAMLQLQSQGVTTVIPFNDVTTNAILTLSATTLGYFPEWFTAGFGGADRNRSGQLQSPNQWQHAFGISTLDMERPLPLTDCYRAYKMIDPNGAPHEGMCTGHFPQLLQLVAGIQEAGPNLNPTTFAEGQFARGYRFDGPGWALGGGFGPGDFTYTDDVVEIWWDPNAVDPVDGTTRGAYRYVREGERYQLGTLPDEDPLVFRDGVTTRPDF